MADQEDLDNEPKRSSSLERLEAALYGEIVSVDESVVAFLKKLPSQWPSTLTTGSVPVVKFHPQFTLEATQFDLHEAAHFDVVDGKSSGNIESDFIGKLLRRKLTDIQRPDEKKVFEIPQKLINFFIQLVDYDRCTLVSEGKHLGRLDSVSPEN